MTPDAPNRHSLERLANLHGVACAYDNWRGEPVTVADAVIIQILDVLGVDARSQNTTDAAIEAAELAPWRNVMVPTVVARQGWTPWVRVHVPHGTEVTLHVRLEDGDTRPVRQVEWLEDPREVDGALVGVATFELDGDLPAGYHTLIATGEAIPETHAALIISPARLSTLGDRRALGIAAQLYQVRDQASWGIGDLRNLDALLAQAKAWHADFVLVNPIHAGVREPELEDSPYRPASRRFRDPLLIDLDGPEFQVTKAEVAKTVQDLRDQAAALNHADTIDRAAVWALKRAALWALYVSDSFDQAAFSRYAIHAGQGLIDWATWSALSEQFDALWTDWPEAYQDHQSAQVARFRKSNAQDVRFHQWLQWLIDVQLGRLNATHPLSIGVMHDLAVGVHPGGADSWLLDDAMARGASVGAPPDHYNAHGQDWSQPPLNPVILAAQGYTPWRDLVRGVLRHAGALRIDHILGMFRQWWIPVGNGPKDGTYVRFDPEAMLGVLVLEAERAGVILVGEDLGTLPDNARQMLDERALLGTDVSWFTHDWDRPTNPQHYRRVALAMASTHDMVPNAGLLALDHVALRDRLGLLSQSREDEQAAEAASVEAVRAAMIADGFLNAEETSPEALTIAMHAWVAAGASQLFAVTLADLAGDRRAINVPGTNGSQYPNWCLPLCDRAGQQVDLATIAAQPFTQRMIEACQRSQ